MNTLEIIERNLKIDVPSHWDEMEPEQLALILRNAFIFSSGVITYHDFMLRAFYSLAGVKRNWKTILWERVAPRSIVEEKNANAFSLASQYADFLLKENKDGLLEINYDTVINHFPLISIKGESWYGPATMLADLTFGEFRAANEEMNDYFRDKDDHSLLRMIACLYRPAAADQDPSNQPTREPFSRSKLETYAQSLGKLEEWKRLTILLWFTWCINYIQTEELLIEGKKISLQVLFPRTDSGDESETKTAGLGWTGVLYSIAKEGLFGNIEQTDKSSLFDVLLFMYDNHLQHNRNRK